MKRLFVLAIGTVLLVALVGACVPAPTPVAPPPATTAPAAGQPTTAPAAVATQPPAPTTAVPAQAGQPVRGGILHVALEQESVTLDPALSVNVPERHILYSVFNTLVRMDEQLNIKPELATSWEQTDKALTLHLQQGVKFQDGTDFDADAVKFNIDRILDPKTGSGQRANIDSISSVDVVDKYTVRFNLKQPYTPLLGYLAERPGFMASPAAITKWGAQFGLHPVGTGPFEFVEWVKDDHITVKRFDGYWEKGADGKSLPYLDQIIFKPIPDQTVKLANLKAGGLELVDLIAPKDIEPLQADKNYTVLVLPGTRWPMMRLNCSVPPFNNKALRQAVGYAVDRDAIISAVYRGLATPAYGPISPVYKDYFQPDLGKDYGTDLNKAKAKLAEAGMPNGFSFTINITNDPVNTQLAQVIQASLAKVGIQAKIASFEPTVWQDKTNKSDFEAGLGSWTPRPDPDGVVYEHFDSKGRVNTSKYSNPDVDKLLDQSRLLPSGPQRTKLFQDAEKLIAADQPWTFLIFESRASAATAKLHDLPAIPDTMFRLKSVWLSK